MSILSGIYCVKKEFSFQMLNGHIEIFIQYNSQCIFYLNLHQPGVQAVKDTQLISGFLDASLLFFSELGYGSNSPIFRILRGKTELRMLIGDPISATLILDDLEHLDAQAYHELDELAFSIVNRFKAEYINEIEELMISGKFHFKGLDRYIHDELNKMKAHMYSSYLMRILGVAINRHVIVKTAEGLLSEFNRIYEENGDLSLQISTEKTTENLTENLIENLTENSTEKSTGNSTENALKKNNSIRARIVELASRSTLKSVIKKVNDEYRSIWELFLVPIIEDHEFKIK